MPDTYGPFDGEDFAEDEWYTWMTAALPSGVIGDPAASATTGELAFAASGLNVSVGTGKAMVGGAGFERTGTPPTQAVTANANATQARRDRLVLRRDLGTHDVTVVRIQGTPAASPTAPAITRTATVFDLKLFSFLVPANNGTTITSVVDERVWLDEEGATDDLTVAGDLTVVGTASGVSPTADSHFATRGYVLGRSKFKAGSASPTSNGSGSVTITHGLGTTPTFVSVTFKTAGVRPYGFVVTSKTSTQFTYRAYYDNVSANNNDHDIDWFVVVTP